MNETNSLITQHNVITVFLAWSATYGIASALQATFSLNPRWVALAVAQLFFFGVAVNAHQALGVSPYAQLEDFVLAFINGGLIWGCAVGSASITGWATGESANVQAAIARRPTDQGGERASSVVSMPRRSFFTSWF